MLKISTERRRGFRSPVLPEQPTVRETYQLIPKTCFGMLIFSHASYLPLHQSSYITSSPALDLILRH